MSMIRERRRAAVQSGNPASSGLVDVRHDHERIRSRPCARVREIFICAPDHRIPRRAERRLARGDRARCPGQVM
jgi:hypothetical protein